MRLSFVPVVKIDKPIGVHRHYFLDVGLYEKLNHSSVRLDHNFIYLFIKSIEFSALSIFSQLNVYFLITFVDLVFLLSGAPKQEESVLLQNVLRKSLIVVLKL